MFFGRKRREEEAAIKKAKKEIRRERKKSQQAEGGEAEGRRTRRKSSSAHAAKTDKVSESESQMAENEEGTKEPVTEQNDTFSADVPVSKEVRVGHGLSKLYARSQNIFCMSFRFVLIFIYLSRWNTPMPQTPSYLMQSPNMNWKTPKLQTKETSK